jgi:RNA polymerase sigma-70 factor (ECF subfamily)
MSEFDGLLAAAQTGAEWAVAVLYRTYNPRLVRFLNAQQPGEGQDIAADAWLDAARNLRTFSGGEDEFRGWLFTIARRRLVDHRRRQGRRPSAGWAILPEPAVPSAEDAALDARLGDEAARRIVSVLPALQAEVVLLRVVAGLSVAEVAAIVGRRPGTVRVLQHRALRTLASHVGLVPHDA